PPGSGGIKKVAPSLLIALALAVILGFLLGSGLVFLVDSLDRGFRTPDEVTRRLGVPVLGQIPFLSGRSTGPPLPGCPVLAPILHACHSPTSAAAEAYRGLSAILSRIIHDQGPRVIQLTSPAVGDGTTTVAANLAIAAAQSGKRVV